MPVPVPRTAPTDDAAAPPTPAAPAGPTGNVLIARMAVHADLSQEAAMPRGPERKQAVYDDLVETARTSQVDALAALAKLQASGDVTKVESMFLPNAILVTTKPGSDATVTQALQGVANVSAVTENHTWNVKTVEGPSTTGAAGAAAGAALLEFARGYIDGPAWRGRVPTDATDPVVEPRPPGVSGAPEWGVAKIGAPAAWSRGIDGTGVTIGVVDTGLDADHPAIKGHYRGTNADGTQSNDYNWFDPLNHAAKPFDDGEHGTHVGGTSAGGTDGHQIGVAPGAKLIAAKAINGAGYNTSDATLKALQWMLAPTRTDGTAPDPTKGADVINNSWGSANPDDLFLESFNALKAAGIEVVSAAGNEGPREGSVSAPGSYPGFLSVAASNARDGIASFSSRGPSKFAKPEDMVPNVAAPGANVMSSIPGGKYEGMSGTSMASPHVAGAVALLLQANPQATHDQIVKALESTATDIDRPGPDTAAGYGRINVNAAIDQVTAGA